MHATVTYTVKKLVSIHLCTGGGAARYKEEYVQVWECANTAAFARSHTSLVFYLKKPWIIPVPFFFGNVSFYFKREL